MTTKTYDLAFGREKLLGHLAMILFAALIALSFSLGSRAAPHIDAAALNAARFAAAIIIMGAVAFVSLGTRRSEMARLPEAAWRYGVLGGLMAVYFVTMFVALKITHPVATGAVFTLTPLMSAIFGYFVLGQSVRPVVMLSIAIAATGSIWVIFRGDIAAIAAFEIGRGEMIFFVGCACHGLYAPLIKRFKRGEPIVLMTFWTVTATGLCIAAYGAPQILATDWTALPPIVWITIAYLAIFTTAITFFLLQFASLRLPAAKVMAYGYLTPCYIVVLEGVSGQGWTSPSVAAGALVIVLGLIVLAFSPDR